MSGAIYIQLQFTKNIIMNKYKIYFWY